LWKAGYFISKLRGSGDGCAWGIPCGQGFFNSVNWPKRIFIIWPASLETSFQDSFWKNFEELVAKILKWFRCFWEIVLVLRKVLIKKEMFLLMMFIYQNARNKSKM